VFGENVRQTLQFAETGNVEAAIVALSLVVNDEDDPGSSIDETLHRPIDQALVVCRGGSEREGGEAFARFVTSEGGAITVCVCSRVRAAMSWDPLILSFQVAIASTCLAGVLGVALAGLMAGTRFRGRDVLDALITAPMVLPPTVLGYYLLAGGGPPERGGEGLRGDHRGPAGVQPPRRWSSRPPLRRCRSW
jgi:ABC-type sugar transport system permease subunit